ncbi:MAG: hypothetical protein LAO31_14135 [Acidobacteriia bacterium]|nr:hypothetical protein [Terriglobia bacterium]
MIRQGWKIVVMIGALILMGAESSRGQSDAMATFNIPFQFLVGENIFPPGDYTVTRHLPTLYQGVLRIHQRVGYLGMIIQPPLPLTSPRGKMSDKGMLVFNRYGNQSFLSEVWIPGDSVGRKLAPSRLEQELSYVFVETKNHGGLESVVLHAGEVEGSGTESGSEK